jgi:DNA polymerase III subunit alpha
MFVHLHCHSHYSFLRAVNSPQEIIAAAVELQMSAVALTDSNGMYAAVPFYQAARAAKVKPILGVVLDVEWGEGRLPGQVSEQIKRQCKGTGSGQEVRMVLLAADMQGYSNLCQLTTLRHLGALQLGQKETFAEDAGRALTIAELAAHSAGVLALCPMEEMWRNEFAHLAASKGEEIKARNHATSDFLAGDYATGDRTATVYTTGAYPTLARLKAIFSDRLYIEVQHLSPGDGRFLREAERAGSALGIPLVATNHVHFVKPEEHLHHRAMNAIRTNTLLTTVEHSNTANGKFADKQGRPEITSKEAWFKSSKEMQRLFPDHPELLRNTLQIAERCNLALELGKRIFPAFPVPQDESPFSYLWKLSFAGAQKRYRPLRPEVLARLTHELEVIEKLSLAPYFLLVWDIVEEANRRGIPAVARGSAASSMVAYCLGISCVCPLRWNLYFERFLNVQRGDCPDIDIDICGARRDELLDYVYERWGAEHVAMIGSFITMHARLAVREIAKVFGVPPGEVNYFTKRLPRRPVREIVEAIKNLPECRDLPVNDEPWKTILQVALRLDDAPRHLGIHPCGTVISARPLTHLAPLERATKGIVVTQYDMNAVEALGLIKMDLLGQRGFTTMSLALDNIDRASQPAEKHRVAADGVTPQPKSRRIDFSAIPENDPETCEVIAAGRTMGLFQIESPGMRELLRSMKARRLEEVAMALALIRPGASEYGSKELFLKRVRGHEAVQFAHESLKPILGDTLGICIYQEQVMQIAQAVGSMSLAEADLVRRSAAKFSGQRERERLRGKFLQAAEKMGLQGEEREETWMMVEKFAGFGFCKAHAATYADISYRMAYLKTHHTAQFLAAMCSAGAGFYHVSAYVEEAKRWGIAVQLPSVNYSRMEYTAEPDPTGWEGTEQRSVLRVGLMQVRGLRVETISAIVRSREDRGVFRSLEDFLARVPVERDEIEALIKCGAFDDLCERSRPAMLWQWNLLQTKWRERGESPAAHADNFAVAPRVLFAELERDDTMELALRELPVAGYTREQKVRYEREILEVCVSGHPLDFLPRNGETWSDELPRLQGKRVTLCGWVVTYRHVGTKNYRNMMFVTLEDQRGLYEVILFPDAYDKYGGMVYETRAMRVTGMVQEGEHINGEKLEKLKGV